MKKILIEYTTNNSGGSFWLKTKDWKKLEKAGWKLFGYDNFVYVDGDYKYGKDGLPEKKESNEKDMFGQYAHYGFKFFSSIKEALEEFEKLTGQDVSDEGCNCCGAPHSFSWDGGFCSGEGCLEYLFPNTDTKLTKRELLTKP